MQAASPLPSLEPDRVLLVDAADDERATLAAALRRSGYQVYEVTDGQAALDEARRSRPSVVVTNFVLPKLSGIDLLVTLRQEEATRELPVIVLADYGQPVDAIVTARAAGANAVRVKPCLPETLRQDVARLLDDSRRIQEQSAEARRRGQEARIRAIAAVEHALETVVCHCPACGAPLESITPRELNAEWRHYFRPCRGGCGTWYYDGPTRQLVLLP